MTDQDGPGRQDPANRTPQPSSARGERSGGTRPRPDLPGSELLTDFQRWLLRSSARSMRKELTGQVRRTFGGAGGGSRPGSADVWDVATSEIPPEVGESPECQWCPVCRAARRMRDSSGPGAAAGPLSGAGDALAGAASDVVSLIDSLLARASGGPREAGGSRDASGRQAAGGSRTASGPDASGPGAGEPAEADSAGPAAGTAADADAASGHEPAWTPPAWTPGAPSARRTEVPEDDPWGAATTADAGTAADSDGGPAGPFDESAHEPDSRS